jgi:hypothetical protein
MSLIFHENSQTGHEPFGPALESSLALKVMDYAHPREVVQDDRPDPEEKRRILCAWASDACAVDSRPGFRWLPGTPGPVLVEHVLAALRDLDVMAGRHVPQHDAPAASRRGPTGSPHLFAPSGGANPSRRVSR